MDELAGNSTTIIRSGIGGLSAACYLADVTVLERNEQLGGRLSRLYRGDFVFDMGPSWYLMPAVFENFYRRSRPSASGLDPEAVHELTHLDPQYGVFFEDGDHLTVSPDVDEVRGLFEDYEDGAGDALLAYLEESRRTYEIGMGEFVYTDRSRLCDWIDPGLIKARELTIRGRRGGFVVDVKRSVHDHPSPIADAPADAPSQVSAGVEEGPRQQAATTDGRTKTSVPTDIIIGNADLAQIDQALLPEEKRAYGESYWASRTYAPAAHMLYLGVEGELPELDQHTLLLPADWSEHFESIFEIKRWRENPSIYFSIPLKTDETVAPEDHHAVVILVPVAPGLDDNPAAQAALRETVFDSVAEYTGVELRDRIVLEESFSVSGFSGRYHSYDGSVLRIAYTLTRTAVVRPNYRYPGVDALYAVGASTNPGIGVPMTLIGGEIAADKIIEDTT